MFINSEFQTDRILWISIDIHLGVFVDPEGEIGDVFEKSVVDRCGWNLPE